MALEINKFIEGTCFICSKNCGSGYCHNECAIAYADEKAKRLKEKNDN